MGQGGESVKLIALMLVRNEEWVIEASLRAALKWCDGAAILLDRCVDSTEKIVGRISDEVGKPVFIRKVDSGENWDEMNLRQQNLEDGRLLGGTHFAIVDADEILTGNLHGVVRAHFELLNPRQVIEAHMISPIDGLDRYRVDSCEWTRARITLGFCDNPSMGWAPRGDEKYQHHARPPKGHDPMTIVKLPSSLEDGGVLHLQWANRARLELKHAWYAVTEMARWPQYGAAVINRRYSYALQRAGLELRPIPPRWWSGIDWTSINLADEGAWRRYEIARLVEKCGREAFSELEVAKAYL